jgi:hypothetical protein
MSPQAGWILQEQVVPRLKSAIPHAVPFFGCEDAEELVQDATAMAARLMHNVEAAGKQVTPGNIAYYTMQLVKSGRRSTRSSRVDVHAAGTQLNGSTRLTSLDEVAAGDVESGAETSRSTTCWPLTRKTRPWRQPASWIGKPAALACRNVNWPWSSSWRKANPCGRSPGHSVKSELACKSIVGAS